MNDADPNADQLAALVEEWQEMLRKGERPNQDDYVRKYPHLADDIRELLPGLLVLDDLKGEALDRTIAPVTLEAPAEGTPTIEQMGDFRILREVGRGGMGVVYEAEQISLGRHVALKVLPQKVFVDQRQKRRFEREAKAAAKLHHTNIVPVYGVGEYEGMPYYVMQFIQGLGLDAVMAEVRRMQQGPAAKAESPAFLPTVTRGDVSAIEVARSLVTGNFKGSPASDPTSGLDAEELPAPITPSSGGSLVSSSPSNPTSSINLPGQSAGHKRLSGKKQTYWQSVAAMGAQIADALEHAHAQGILHRDIKPSNLLLDTRGTVWVTDFGLAKAADHGDDLTHTGDVLGTLRYMPPEAFEGRSDARGDIYSLGLTLYELLALKPAFGEKDRHKLVKQVTTTDPERLQRLNPAIPRDLATIVHKAIERDPLRRYQSAREFDDDLERFLANEPILARRSGPVERAVRWVRRKPAAAALVGVSTIAAIALAASVVVVLYNAKLQDARIAADAARRLAEQARDAEAAERAAADAARIEALRERNNAFAARLEAEALRTEAEVEREKAVLQRGLLAVQTGQWPEAVNDLERYTKRHTGNLEAWLGLGKAHAGLDQAAKAVDAFGKVIAISANHIGARTGRAEQEVARGRLDAAIADFEHIYQLHPDQFDQAAPYARALYERSAGWRTLLPSDLSATGGTVLKSAPDGSIYSERVNNNTDSFAIVARTNLSGIRAIRLETMPEMPRNAAARRTPVVSGNFILSEFVVTATGLKEPARPVALSRAWSSFLYPQQQYYVPANARERPRQDIGSALDGDAKTGWVVIGQYNRATTAVFLPAQPFGGPGGSTLTIKLQFSGESGYRQNYLGLFRLAVSTNSPAPGWECLMTSTAVGGWTKLAAARYLRGDRAGALQDLARTEKVRLTGDDPVRQIVRSIVMDQPEQKDEALAAYAKGLDQLKNYRSYNSTTGDQMQNWLAAEAAARWSERDPGNPEFRRHRIDALVKLENWLEAIDELTNLIKVAPKETELLLERGSCYVRSGAAALANIDFATAAELNAKDALAWHIQRITEYEQAANWTAALPHIEACVASEKGKPAEADMLLKRARCLRNLNLNERARQDFIRVLELKPDSVDGLLERGGQHAEQQRFDAAKDDFTAARKLNPTVAQQWHSTRINQLDANPTKNVDLQLLYVNEAIAAYGPGATGAYLYQRRARIYRQLKDYRKAIGDFTTALDAATGDIYSLAERAECHALAGDLDKAKSDLNAAIRLGGASYASWFRSRLTGLEQSANWPFIVVYADAIMATRPSLVDERNTLRARARANFELRRYERALADCERFMAISPKNPASGKYPLGTAATTVLQAQVFSAMALEFRMQGKDDDAARAVDRARNYFKTRYAAAPADNQRAAEYANYLLGVAAGWRPLKWDDVKSAGGATLTRLPDGSILASGPNPKSDVYTLVGQSGVALQAFRLDVMPDASLPDMGPGRHANGNFLLSKAALSSGPASTPDALKPQRWRGALASYTRPIDQFTTVRDGPRGAIDGDDSTHWEIGPQNGRGNFAVFATDRTVGDSAASLLALQLEFKDPHWSQTSLGRFRVVGSTSRYALHCEELMAFTGGGAQTGLAAAFALTGERDNSKSLLDQLEPALANDAGIDWLLFAWTADLLGLNERAQAARAKFVNWLAQKTSYDGILPLPAVTVDVLDRANRDQVQPVIVRRWLARALYALGDQESSLAAYNRAIAATDDDRELYLGRGALHMRLRHWKLALADFQKAIDLKPDEHYLWLTTAPLFLLVDDEAAYRGFREKLLQRFANTTEPLIAERMAKASSLHPATAAEARSAVALAKRAVASTANPLYRHWFHLAYALASFRAHDLGTAIEQARLARERDTPNGTPLLQVASRWVEALAQQRLGKEDEAKSIVAEAKKLSAQSLANIESANPTDTFHDLLLCRFLEREAEAAMSGAGPAQRGPPPRVLPANADR